MFIELPKHFFYSTDKRSCAYVQDDVLVVEGQVNYEELMYTLSYALKGYETCAYCGKKLEPKTRTLDHVFPRNWGGISIPDNLVPTCNRCNHEKSNLTDEQYSNWLALHGEAKEEFRRKCIDENTQSMKNQSFILPNDWVSMFNTALILPDIDLDWIAKAGNEGLDKYYENNGHYPRPIILSANYWLFKGFHILYHAKEHEIREVPAVILENVIRIRKRN